MATKANITIDQGATFSTEIVLTDEAGNLLDLSVYTGESQIRKSYTSSTAKSFDVSLANGIVTLFMAANTTATMTAGRYVYDVILVDGANNVTRIVEGIVTVTPRVSQ
jgi:endoglucanase Acf2